MPQDNSQTGLDNSQAGATAPDSGASSPGLDVSQQAPGQGQDTTTTAPAKPAAVDLSEETVKRLAGALAPSQQAPQQPAQPQLTPEQIDDMLKVVKFNDPDLAEALGLDEERTPKAAKFMRDLVNKIITHINVVSDVRQKLFTKEHITPLQAYMQRVQNEALERQFFDTFPNLKPHAKVAKLVYNDMINRGVRFSSPDDAFPAIAKATMDLVGASGGGDNSSPAGNGGSQAPQMSTVSMGGRASGAATGQRKESNPVKELFG